MRIILLGVALGLLARFMLGNPVPENGHDRSFHGPVDESLLESAKTESPDFPLDPDWDSASNKPKSN